MALDTMLERDDAKSNLFNRKSVKFWTLYAPNAYSFDYVVERRRGYQTLKLDDQKCSRWPPWTAYTRRWGT